MDENILRNLPKPADLAEDTLGTITHSAYHIDSIPSGSTDSDILMKNASVTFNHSHNVASPIDNVPCYISSFTKPN